MSILRCILTILKPPNKNIEKKHKTTIIVGPVWLEAEKNCNQWMMARGADSCRLGVNVINILI